MARVPTRTPTSSVLDDLPFSLARTTLAFRRFSDRTLAAVGLQRLAPGLATVLHAVEELGDCPVSQLVDATHLPNGTLTGFLDTLERDGYIKRVRNPKDGRSRLIQLTAKGQRVCAKLHERHRMVMEVFAEALSSAESAELTRLLETLGDRMRLPLQTPNSNLRPPTTQPIL